QRAGATRIAREATRKRTSRAAREGQERTQAPVRYSGVLAAGVKVIGRARPLDCGRRLGRSSEAGQVAASAKPIDDAIVHRIERRLSAPAGAIHRTTAIDTTAIDVARRNAGGHRNPRNWPRP